MKNKKILRAIAAMAVGSVMVAGSFSLAACGGHKHTWGDAWVADGANGHYHVCTEDESHHSDNQQHEMQDGECKICHWSSTVTPPPAGHTHSYSWVDNNNGTHTGTCANSDGNCTTVTVTEAHDTNGTDGACSKCGYKEGGTVTPPPVTKENAQLNVSDIAIGSLTSGQVLLDGIKSVGTPAVDANSKKVVYNGSEVSVANRIKLSQKFIQTENNASKSMGFEVNLEANATILVYAYSGTSGTKRDLALYDSTKTIIGTAQSIGDGNAMNTAKFEVEANKTYYIGAHSDAGVNVYYIAVFYKDYTETWTHHDAVPAACTTKGSIEYSSSNYGRYKKADDSIITYDAIAIADLGGHSYSLKADSIVKPTQSGEGSAVLSCATGNEELPITLPKLDDPLYTKDTTASDLAEGQARYTITKEGVTITFDAENVQAKEYEFVDRYTNLFATAQSLGFGADNATTLIEGVKGYGTVNDASVTAWSDTTYNVKTENGTLSVIDKSTKSSFAYILFDTAKTSGVYKITGNIKVNQSSGKWNVLQLVDGSDAGLEGRFAALRSDSSKKWALSLDGAQDTEIGTRYGSAISTTTTYCFEFVLDLDNNTITLKVGVAPTTGEPTYTTLGNADPTTITLTNGWKGIKLQTGDSASRTIELSNFVIQERVEKTTV